MAVDRLLGRVEAVIQALKARASPSSTDSPGPTILGDGSVSLILDLSQLLVAEVPRRPTNIA